MNHTQTFNPTVRKNQFKIDFRSRYLIIAITVTLITMATLTAYTAVSAYKAASNTLAELSVNPELFAAQRFSASLRATC